MYIKLLLFMELFILLIYLAAILVLAAIMNLQAWNPPTMEKYMCDQNLT